VPFPVVHESGISPLPAKLHPFKIHLRSRLEAVPLTGIFVVRLGEDQENATATPAKYFVFFCLRERCPVTSGLAPLPRFLILTAGPDEIGPVPARPI